MNSDAHPTNLLMLKLARTGSTYLANLLGKHERIRFHQEYLNSHEKRRTTLMRGPLGTRGVRRITGYALQLAKWRDLAELLTTSTDHLIVGASLNPFKERLQQRDLAKIVNEGTRIILLTRSNALKQYVSHLNVAAEKKAGTARPYKSYNKDGKPIARKFFIGPDAIKEIERLETQRTKLFQIAQGVELPTLHLSFEEHINVTDKTPLLELLADFLEIDASDEWRSDIRPAANAPNYHKILSDDLRDLIENYEDIASAAKFSKYL